MRKRTIYIIILCFVTIFTTTKAAIGQWYAYMAYGEITDIEPAEKNVYVLSSGSLFSYNINEQSVNVYNKVYPLNDTDIAYIAWCKNAKKLVIVYSNHNIDLLDNNENVTNISDYYTVTMTEDKTVNNITINGYYAYLSTNFGILKINVRDAEISNTYNLGMAITDCMIEGNYIYAKTVSGIYAGNTSDNLLDKANWHKISNNISFNDVNDITISNVNGYTEYIAYDATNKCYWSNQSNNKLQGYKLNDEGEKTIIAQDINPNGPKYNYFGFMKIYNNKLYACNGGMWDAERAASIQILTIEDNKWTIYDNEGIGEKYNIKYQNILTIDVDLTDNRRVIAGTQTGIYEFYDGALTTHYDNTNSTLSFFNGLEGNKNYIIVPSVMFSENGNLYVTNSENKKNPLMMLSKDGGWKTFIKTSGIKRSDNMKLFEVEDNGNIWMYNDYWENPAIYLYNTVTDNLYEYSNFVNEDGTTINSVQRIYSMTKDKKGNLWIGTNVGLLLLPPDYQADPSKGFYQIKVPRNDGTNLADYLLSGIGITTIVVDNANRKWIGTDNNGLYVISSDNMVEEEHFTMANSSIISNTIESIVIDNNSGMVYIGTDKGLCSYQSDATPSNEEMNKDNVWAYPNPVHPEYSGYINIVGLSINADVKIMTSNGTIVAEGRSAAGTFQWDGKDKNGKRVASGIYMVATATSDGEKGTVCKIAIIR